MKYITILAGHYIYSTNQTLNNVKFVFQVNSPFKRQLSLRLTELPSTVTRQKSSLSNLVPHQEASSELDTSGEIPDPILPSIGESNETSNKNEFKSHLEELSSLIIDNPSQESSMENQMVIILRYDISLLAFTYFPWEILYYELSSLLF